MFNLKRPCPTCPFRRQPRFCGLRRAEEIADCLLAGDAFFCHETVHYSDDGEGDIVVKSQMCTGAMMVLHQEEGVWTNQMARICARFPGDDQKIDWETFPETHYDFDGVPVYSDFDEFIETVSD